MSAGQDSFTAALLDPEAAAPPGLTDPQGRPAGKRFDVYRNNVAASLTDALETGFPAIRTLLGRQNFRRLAGIYLRKHPPRSALMMHYGAAMPGFLESFAPLAKYPFLGDVARLELALRKSYHAADAVPVDPARVAAMPPEALMAARVRFAPAAALVRSRWPVHAIWRYNMEPDAPKPVGAGQNVLITRPEFDPAMTVLPAGGGSFVAALMDGQRMDAALDTTLARVPDFDPAPTLGRLIEGAAITDITQEDRP